MSPRDKRVARHQLKEAQRKLKDLEFDRQHDVRGGVIARYREKHITNLQREIAELKATC